MVRTPTPLWYVASNCCLKFAQGATINGKRFCSTCGISASTCLPFNSNTYGSSILHSYRIAQLFQQQKAAALIYSAHLAVMVTYWLSVVDTFCVQNLLNKKFGQAKSYFCFQLDSNIVFESTDLDVVKKVLVDAEQSVGNFGSQVRSIHYFLVSASESTTNLLFIQQRQGERERETERDRARERGRGRHRERERGRALVYVSYVEAKKQLIIFKYTLISTILNTKYFSTLH